ncbi:MAG: helix-turn-helix transcriptional regulator [Phycisphaerales bacterium]
MARNFKELEAGMTPERRARVEAMARDTMIEMLLSEIRLQAGLTQTDLANTLGIKQPSMSKLEAQEDMQISTLRRIVKALGGELELIANLPGGTVKLSQFKDDLQPV